MDIISIGADAPQMAKATNEYWEGTMNKEFILQPGDRVQVWPNNRKTEGRQPDFKFKVLRGPKNVSKSQLITGLWRRIFTPKRR